MQTTTQTPAITIDFLEDRNTAGFARIGTVIMSQPHEVIDCDRLLIIRLATPRHRLNDRLQRCAVGGFIRQHLDATYQPGHFHGLDRVCCRRQTWQD